ncbi:MAG: hypothetical protein L6Q53_12680 [Candidatus Brocadia sinica]|nr:hypothetical protein [Candidatus Brocadia sinica]NUO07014.1 hypothetical protein [Candidatus Brocadia sinica]
MSVLLVTCDVYGQPREYHDLLQYFHGTFFGSFFELSNFSYIVDTELRPQEICDELSKYLKSRDGAYVFTLASRGFLTADVLLNTYNRNDAVSWLRERLKYGGNSGDTLLNSVS